MLLAFGPHTDLGENYLYRLLTLSALRLYTCGNIINKRIELFLIRLKPSGRGFAWPEQPGLPGRLDRDFFLSLFSLGI